MACKEEKVQLGKKEKKKRMWVGKNGKKKRENEKKNTFVSDFRGYRIKRSLACVNQNASCLTICRVDSYPQKFYFHHLLIRPCDFLEVGIPLTIAQTTLVIVLPLSPTRPYDGPILFLLFKATTSAIKNGRPSQPFTLYFGSQWGMPSKYIRSESKKGGNDYTDNVASILQGGEGRKTKHKKNIRKC